MYYVHEEILMIIIIVENVQYKKYSSKIPKLYNGLKRIRK